MTKQIVSVVEKLTELHETLLNISQEKTEVIKQNDLDALIKLLTKERQYVQQVEQQESLREEMVANFLKAKKIPIMEPTITQLLDVIADETERETLEKAVTKLIEVIVLLKDSEKLNQQLLEQSLQFVQLSLSMMQPDLKNINYAKNNKQQNKTKKISMFDSKV